MLTAGIDVGSVQTKAVIIDPNRVVQGRGCVHSGANLARAARHAFESACREAGVKGYDITYVLGTGYGRKNIPFSNSESAAPQCIAKGTLFRYPKTRTILDIGGQETTAIKIDEYGVVQDFCLNDKCDSGIGRFIESIAELLNLDLGELGHIGTLGTKSLDFGNLCSVIAEVEIINYVERGEKVEDIVTSIFSSLADRTTSLLQRIGIEEEVALVGGVSPNKGLVRAISDKIKLPLNCGVDGVYIGALGAALLGLEQAQVGVETW